MIKTLFIEPGLRDVDEPVYDYGALDSIDEFKSLADPATIIFLVDKDHPEKSSIAFGLEALRAISHKVIPPQEMKVLQLAISFNTLQLEHALAAIQVTKGFHEYK